MTINEPRLSKYVKNSLWDVVASAGMYVDWKALFWHGTMGRWIAL